MPKGTDADAKWSSKKRSKKSKSKKKSKKRARQRSESSSSSGSSGSGGDWVEKQPGTSAATTVSPRATATVSAGAPAAGVQDEQQHGADEWLRSAGLTLSASNADRRVDRQERQREMRAEEERQQQARLEALTWRDRGGAGTARPVGDGGAGWMQRALERARQQAAEQDRPLEEVVADRWGSMEKFNALLKRTHKPRPDAPTESSARSERRPGWRRSDQARDRCRRGHRRQDCTCDQQHRGSSRSPSRCDSAPRRHETSSRRAEPSSHRSEPSSHRSEPSFHRLEPSSCRAELSSSRSEPSSHRSETSSHRSETSSHRLETSSHRSADRRRSEHRGRSSRRSSADSSESSDAGDLRRTADRSGRTASPTDGRSTSSRVDATNGKHPSADRLPVKDSVACDGEDARRGSTADEQLTAEEMNALAARAMKAELNDDLELAATLRARLEAARSTAQPRGVNGCAAPRQQEVIVVPDSVPQRKDQRTGRGRKRGETAMSADAALSVQQLRQQEWTSSAADEQAGLHRAVTRVRIPRRRDDEHDLDDVYEETTARPRDDAERLQRQALSQHRAQQQCRRCVEGGAAARHLICALTERCYLALPPGRSLVTGHCLLVPSQHMSSWRHADEDVWQEMGRMRACLQRMFAARGCQLVVFETAVRQERRPHAVLHCVPVPDDTAYLAPIYFKKALQECESEWSQNRKVISLKGKGLRNAVPKGLDYFFVEFENDPGFAHVVEDVNQFSDNFAQEVIGGMLELEPQAWRGAKHEPFTDQCAKVNQFCKSWNEYDYTRSSEPT